jgi:hypothetical protein
MQNQLRSLADLPSLGATSAALLTEVGIVNADSLRRHGAKDAFMVLRMRFGKRITINWIYALECAIQGIHWKSLSDERRAELKAAAKQVIADLEKNFD